MNRFLTTSKAVLTALRGCAPASGVTSLPPSPRNMIVAAAGAALAAATLAGCGGGGGGGGGSTPPPPPPPPPAAQYRPSGKAATGTAFVHLFEWRWADIARECETWLGPKGYGAVQISPPNEHALINGAPWWQRYQPVSYKLDRSRSGTTAEFSDMVRRCQAVGVDIYADAVINHMASDAGINGTGSAGSSYQKYSYPAVPYGQGDFHSACAINNYQNRENVQNCELVGLPDLKTESDAVRQKIADYLIALHRLGVKGFRIDAAKHMPPADLDAILSRVNQAATAEGRSAPYVFLEVINNSGEAVLATDYYGVGYNSGGAADLTEFQYGYRVSDAFLGRNGASLAGLANLASGLLPSDKAVVFTDNHDNQRDRNAYYADGAPYLLASLYLFAQPHGYPALMSGYGFDRSSQSSRDSGPPSDNGTTQSTFDASGNSRCSARLGGAQAGQWVCEHRVPAIANAIAFRKFTTGAPQSNWQQLTTTQVAFARTGKGFAAFNRDTVPSATTAFQTTLPAGRYCDIANGDFNATTQACTGPLVTVNADGTASLQIPAQGAVLIHGGARL